MALTDAAIRNAKPRDKAYKLTDAQGLYLQIQPRGTKLWYLKFRINGKESRIAFGGYPAISLGQARAECDKAKALIAQGISPTNKREQEKDIIQNTHTFELVARDWHASNKKWSAQHSERVLRYFEMYLFPAIGQRNIDELKIRDLLAPLRVVEQAGKLDVAARLQQRITCVMRYAVQNGLIEYNPAQDLAGALVTRKATHRAALPLERLPELLLRMDDYCGRPLTRMAVKFCLLVFIRSSELRFARWDEIDLERALWTLPAERKVIDKVRYSHRGSKMKTPHLVPLSRQAIAVLEKIKTLTQDENLVFPGDHHPNRPMSENTINNALRRMGYDTKTEVCGHGFRTMACSALVESGMWSRDAVERQMSHQERNNVRAAYIHKAEHMDERRLMVQWWADYLDRCRDGYVVPYHFSGKDSPE
ncbi:tyrosine-type recombinase/integrase [Yersinia proxima]|uniref:tyrosine-type recombinase/integrase n=1 Tax=Yersinia proxima TaxID=2890316 RepID=UPI003D68BDBA